MATRIRSKSISVSYYKLFGRTEMDKTIEKYTEQGWTLISSTPIGNNRMLLRFEMEEEVNDDSYDGIISWLRNGGFGVIIVACFGFAVLWGIVQLGNTTNRTQRTTQRSTPAILDASPTNSAQATSSGAVVSVVSTAVPGNNSEPSDTPFPTQTPTLTDTPRPASTRRPTRTPRPSATPRPTRTPRPPVTPHVISSQQSINVRSCASTDCEIIGQLSPGATLSVVASVSGEQLNGSDRWFQFELNGSQAFVHGSLAVPQRNTVATASPRSTMPPRAVISAAQNRSDAISIENTLFLLAGGRNIEYVRITNGRPNGGERALLIGFLTTASTTVDAAEEVIDIFDAAGYGIMGGNIDVDSISLLVGDPFGNAVGVFVASKNDLIAFVNGRITRSEFLNRLEVVPF